MGVTSLQVCMDTSGWLQGSVHEDSEMDSSPPSGDMITCSRPLPERRLRPQHDQALKCPRCDSTHTKFCYYNNYSLSQPRYFCKTCRRYWTKGGTLRNIPVGGGCRKNKRVSVKKSTDQPINQHPTSFEHNSMTNLHLSFPELQLAHLTTLMGNPENLGNPNLMENKYNAILENPRPIDFMESKFDSMLGNSRNHDFMGNGDFGIVGGFGGVSHGFTPPTFHGLCSPFGISLDGNNGTFMDSCQRLMLPFEGSEDPNVIEMKPNNKLLSLDWPDQGCSDVGKDSFGYVSGLGSWTGAMNGYGSSATNPLF